LQVLYTINGGRDAPVVEHVGIAGYRRSQPVRTGNAAIGMIEKDSYGYLMDCVLTYLQHDGEWRPDYWTLIKRIADFTAEHWHEPGSSIWELEPRRHFMASKVMSAVTLDRAAQIAKIVGHGKCAEEWIETREEIFAEIMARGWSDRLGAFRQHYDADTLDASALLIPLMGLLPVHHPRVRSTIEKLIQQLEINGFLHRFVHSTTIAGVPQAIGDEEGAFLICSFWLVQVLAELDELEIAETILRRAEDIAGELRLFAEAIDARSYTFLGNMPLVFSQAEYARAAIALSQARDRVGSQPAAPARQ
jgi:GH15 family glucan-1,4-alpha-glucosidase